MIRTSTQYLLVIGNLEKWQQGMTQRSDIHIRDEDMTVALPQPSIVDRSQSPIHRHHARRGILSRGNAISGGLFLHVQLNPDPLIQLRNSVVLVVS